MRDLRHHLRALAALIAGFSCLAMPVFVSGVVGTLADSHHGDAAVAQVVAQLQPAESGHDSCWVAEVDAHQRHDDHRFEPQRGLHHHLHAGVAWSSTASVEPGVALQADLPRLECDASLDQPRSLRALERSSRQSRAPPRA